METQAEVSKLTNLVASLRNNDPLLNKIEVYFKIHTILLELPPKKVQALVRSICTSAFVRLSLDLAISGEAYTHLPLRVLDHICLNEICRKIVEQAGAIGICTGLLRTENYELQVSCLSLLASVLKPSNIPKFTEAGGVRIIFKMIEKQDLEYLYYITQILDTILASDKTSRNCLIGNGFISILTDILEHNEDLQKATKLWGSVRRIRNEIRVWELNTNIITIT